MKIQSGTLNVAIGGSFIPQNKLHIHNTASIHTYTQYTNLTTNSGSTNGTLVGIDLSGNTIINQQENLSFYLKTNNTNALVIDSSQTIGIKGKVFMSGITSDDTPNEVLYYNNITKEITSGLKVIPSPLSTMSGITSNTNFGIIYANLTLGMIYITNYGSVTSNVNLGITPTGNEINPYGIISIPPNEVISITINRRMSNTTNYNLYISSSNWTNVNLKIEWGEVNYLNQTFTAVSEAMLIAYSIVL